MNETGKAKIKTKINNDTSLVRVYRAIGKLKQPERRIIELFFGDHNHPAKSIKEIAEAMGMDLKKANVLKNKGIKSLIAICRKLRKHV